MSELKWEAYFINGINGEVIDIKTLTEEQRRKLSYQLNKQCAESVVIRTGTGQMPDTG